MRLSEKAAQLPQMTYSKRAEIDAWRPSTGGHPESLMPNAQCSALRELPYQKANQFIKRRLRRVSQL